MDDRTFASGMRERSNAHQRFQSNSFIDALARGKRSFGVRRDACASIGLRLIPFEKNPYFLLHLQR
jgi:hypothetical protein